MEQLKQMKDILMGCVQGQMSHLETVDTKELGEAIDMIKDLSEAIYYCTITEAMEEKYPTYKNYDERDIDRSKGRMYYGDYKMPMGRPYIESGRDGHHTEREWRLDEMMHDRREGRSPVSRKMYMESKEMHKDKSVQMQELEKYAQELTADIVEMIEEATPEEKQYLQNRITALAGKIK